MWGYKQERVLPSFLAVKFRRLKTASSHELSFYFTLASVFIPADGQTNESCQQTHQEKRILVTSARYLALNPKSSYICMSGVNLFIDSTLTPKTNMFFFINVLYFIPGRQWAEILVAPICLLFLCVGLLRGHKTIAKFYSEGFYYLIFSKIL